MIRVRAALLAVGVFLCLAPVLRAESPTIQRGKVVRRAQACPNDTAFSTELPVIARIQGTAFFRTSVDIINNSSKNGVIATFQYSYTCTSGNCNPNEPGEPGFFHRTSTAPAAASVTLQALDSFHQDDMVKWLDDQGLLKTGAAQGSYGPLLVTFTNLSSCFGWEGSVVARTYNRIDEADPSQGTVGFAYKGSLFWESAAKTLVGFARDTKSSPTIAGKLRSNVGVRNTDVNLSPDTCPGVLDQAGVPEKGCLNNLVFSFFDTVSGQEVGTRQTFAKLRAGELRQIGDLWATAGIPSTVHSVIIFVDNPSPSANPPTFEGYAALLDGQRTQDIAFFEMKCADDNGCGN